MTGLHIMHYDRGDGKNPTHRPIKNAEVMKTSLNGTSCEFETIYRPTRFLTEPNAEDVLLSGAVGYDGIILNAGAQKFNDIFDAAQMAFEGRERSIIVLSHHGTYNGGVQTVPIHDPVGYMNSKEAAYVATILYRFAEEKQRDVKKMELE